MPNSKTTSKVPSTRDLPATQGMLQLVRKELKADNRSLRSEIMAGFSKLDARFSQMDAKFNQMDSKFSQIDSKFNQMDSKFSLMDAKFSQMDTKFSQMDAKFEGLRSSFELVHSEVARIGVVIEEQNVKTNIALEGLIGLNQRQNRFEENLVKEVNLAVDRRLARPR